MDGLGQFGFCHHAPAQPVIGVGVCVVVNGPLEFGEQARSLLLFWGDSAVVQNSAGGGSGYRGGHGRLLSLGAAARSSHLQIIHPRTQRRTAGATLSTINSAPSLKR